MTLWLARPREADDINTRLTTTAIIYPVSISIHTHTHTDWRTGEMRCSTVQPNIFRFCFEQRQREQRPNVSQLSLSTVDWIKDVCNEYKGIYRGIIECSRFRNWLIRAGGRARDRKSAWLKLVYRFVSIPICIGGSLSSVLL